MLPHSKKVTGLNQTQVRKVSFYLDIFQVCHFPPTVQRHKARCQLWGVSLDGCLYLYCPRNEPYGWMDDLLNFYALSRMNSHRWPWTLMCKWKAKRSTDILVQKKEKICFQLKTIFSSTHNIKTSTCRDVVWIASKKEQKPARTLTLNQCFFLVHAKNLWGWKYLLDITQNYILAMIFVFLCWTISLKLSSAS